MTSSLSAQLESILFVATKPLSFRKLALLFSVSEKEVREHVDALASLYRTESRGIQVQHDDSSVQFVTAREHAERVQTFLRDETSGELTRPSLETLAIISYRGPVSKAEIELIRGVNCSIILRNLMIRGLVEERQEKEDLVAVYSVTLEFLKFLGATSVRELPDYEKLNANKSIDELLEKESTNQSPDQ